jgi:polygalacturonase
MVATAATLLVLAGAFIPLAASVDGVFDVLRHGAIGDGRTDDGAAIRAAYAACRAAGGGTVLFRGGHTFISGPIDIACNDSVTVVEGGATIRARNTTDGWPFGLDCPEPSQGKTPKQMAPMLQVLRGRNVSIEGGGEIDANGEMWWANACGNWWCQPTADQTRGPTAPTAFRPFHFRVDHSEHVRIQNVSLKNSGFWTLVPVHSSNLRVLDVNVSAEYTHRPANWPEDRHDLLDTPNTDGIEVCTCASRYIVLSLPASLCQPRLIRVHKL